MYRVKNRLIKISVISGLLLIMLLLSFSISCADMEQFRNVLASSDFSVLQVPDVPLDLYVYAKQKTLTKIPADLINTRQDISVESIALWGVPSGKSMALGIGLTLDSEGTAKQLYPMIVDTPDIWKFQRANNLYVVKGTGTGARALQNAIKLDDFKEYKDRLLIESAGMLPQTVRAKLIGIALIKPTPEVIQFAREQLDMGQIVNEIAEVIKSANVQSIVAGLYSPNYINIAKAAEIARTGGNIAELNIGLIVGVKSGLPGVILEPNVTKILLQQGLKEKEVDSVKLLKGYWNVDNFAQIPVYVRIENNWIFFSLSGQEAYAETLIRSIYK